MSKLIWINAAIWLRPTTKPAIAVAVLTLVGIFMIVAVAFLSNKEQSKAAWMLAAVVIVLAIIADRIH